LQENLADALLNQSFQEISPSSQQSSTSHSLASSSAPVLGALAHMHRYDLTQNVSINELYAQQRMLGMCVCVLITYSVFHINT
jgi:hypothetical protein